MSQLSTNCFLKPDIFSHIPGLVAAESTRHGGLSLAPYASLNLGLNTEDDPAVVEQNRQFFFNRLGLQTEQVASTHQVHGDRILKVDQPGRWDGFDALITQTPAVFLTVGTADCTPILIADPNTRAVAAIHAGWKGTAAQIAAKAIRSMEREYGTKAADCYAYIGTCIDECSFEVNADVADHFATAHKRWDEVLQKYFVDLKAANRTQLLQAGVPAQQIEVSLYSTVAHNEHFFSHRKEKGLTGRMLSLIGFRE